MASWSAHQTNSQSKWIRHHLYGLRCDICIKQFLQKTLHCQTPDHSISAEWTREKSIQVRTIANEIWPIGSSAASYQSYGFKGNVERIGKKSIEGKEVVPEKEEIVWKEEKTFWKTTERFVGKNDFHFYTTLTKSALIYSEKDADLAAMQQTMVALEQTKTKLEQSNDNLTQELQNERMKVGLVQEALMAVCGRANFSRTVNHPQPHPQWIESDCPIGFTEFYLMKTVKHSFRTRLFKVFFVSKDNSKFNKLI